MTFILRYPNATLAKVPSYLNGDHTNVDEDPDAPDGEWIGIPTISGLLAYFPPSDAPTLVDTYTPVGFPTESTALDGTFEVQLSGGTAPYSLVSATRTSGDASTIHAPGLSSWISNSYYAVFQRSTTIYSGPGQFSSYWTLVFEDANSAQVTRTNVEVRLVVSDPNA